MIINLTFYGLLREKLPRESRGKVAIDLPEGSTIRQVISKLDLTGQLVFSVNGQITYDQTFPLKDGDEMSIFNPTGGG